MFLIFAWLYRRVIHRKRKFEILFVLLSRTNFGRYDEEEDDSSRVSGGRFRSRFLRGDDDDDNGGGGGGNRSSIYEESGGDKSKKAERIKVVETEDCSRGPLSGCIRLADSSRVIQRLKVSEILYFLLRTKW